MKRGLIVVTLMVAAFAVGYGSSSAHAWPFFGRNPYYGYFNNLPDSSGGDVMPRLYDGGVNAIPNSVDTAAELISFVNSNFSGTNQQRIGAAFIVDTMLGGDHVYPPSSQDMAQWETNLYYYEASGWIGWFTAFNYSKNSLYQGTGTGTNPNDDTFFDDTATATSITFTGSGGFIKYGIRRQCANPVGTGGLAPLDQKVFTTRGYSTVSNATPAPGSSITFRHYVVNDGPSSIWPQTMFWFAEQTLPTSVTLAGPSPDGNYTDIGNPHNVYNHTFTIPVGTAAGTQYCERVGWTPVDSMGGANGRGTPVCATVTPDYNLNPVTSVNQTTAQDGDTLTFTYTIENTGGGASPAAQCHNRDGAGNPVGTALTCSSSQVFPGGGGPVTVGTENVAVGAQPAGTTICRQLVVQPATSSVASRASTMTCAVMAKKPYVRFMGNDVWAGGGFAAVNASCNTSAKITTVGKQLSGFSSPSRFAGSVVEYNAFALDRVFSFGSSSRILVGTGNSLGTVARQLTFANNEADLTKLGYFGAAQHCIEDYIATYQGATSSGSTSINVSSACNRTLHLTGDVTFTGASIAAGCQQAYLVNGDVTISGSLTYINSNPSFATANDIPSLIIIAAGTPSGGTVTKGNIFVQAPATQMDGLFVARNTFYTCHPKVEPATVSACNNLLTVNGSVLAGRLDLFRTAGGDGATYQQRQSPAEVFNFSPELYIRNVLSSSSAPYAEISNIQELPPRF